MCCGDAVNEDKLLICNACCCSNCSIYPACDALGVSGKMGILCCNLECCFKPGAPCLIPCGCCGCKCENEGLSVVHSQCHFCCCVSSCAIPCNHEVPLAVAAMGVMCYPKCGFLVKQKNIMER